MLPFPGTPDAALGTNVYFPAVPPGQIASVRVAGSRSGVHGGHLSAQPDHAGTAFSPARPFAAGERVSVRARLRSAAAGTASGARGACTLRFSFSVARPAHLAESTKTSSPHPKRHSTYVPPGTHAFVTEPHFHVPRIKTTGKDTDTSSGYIFIDSENAGPSAAYMVDGKGRLLWYKPSKRHGGAPAVFNVRVQRYRSRSVITYWHGKFVHGLGEGDDLVLNSSYRTIHTVRAGDGYQNHGTDLHEFTLARAGHQPVAFVPIWSPVHANLERVGGPANGVVEDWIIQEIDLATNKVIWEWHALGHVPIDDTYNTYVAGQPLDYFHLNSIQELGDRHLIISARNTWGVYSIDMKTGRIAWELGGKHSSFSVGSGAHFEWQHHATLHPNGLLTVFDDGFDGVSREESQSRALEIDLNTSTRRATLARAFRHNPPVLASSGGDVESLRNHNVFVGWGAGRGFSEYTSSGRQIFTASFIKPIESYRAFRLRWTGAPTWPPAIAARTTRSNGQFNVYASWNGATKVKWWLVRGSGSPTGPFTVLRRRVAWASFETRIPVRTRDTYFQVQALGPKGNVLPHGTSAVVRPHR